MTPAEGGWEPGRALARARATLVRCLPRTSVNRALLDAGLDGVRTSWTAPVQRYEGGAVEVACVVRPPATPEAVVSRADVLRTSLGVPVEVEQTPYPRRVTVFLGTGTPPAQAYPWPALPDVGTPLRDVDALPLGVDGRGRPVRVSLWDSAGGRALLVSGQPGAGKSNGLQVLLSGLTATSTVLVVLDPKGGRDFAPFGSRIQLVDDATDANAVLGVLDDLVALIQRRGVLAREVQPQLPFVPRVLLVVDEWADLATSDPKVKRTVDDRLRTILRTGRAFGVSVICATQQPTSDSIDTTARALMQARLAFALPNVDAAKAAGVLGSETLHATRDKGVALLDDGTAAPVKARVYRFDPEGLVGCLCSGYQRSLQEQLRWEASIS